jgi:hypothetical protein
MNLKSRLDKLEQQQSIWESTEGIPESLSPREQYMRLINAPIKTIKTDKTKPSTSFSSPQDAYNVLIGKVS